MPAGRLPLDICAKRRSVASVIRSIYAICLDARLPTPELRSGRLFYHFPSLSILDFYMNVFCRPSVGAYALTTFSNSACALRASAGSSTAVVLMAFKRKYAASAISRLLRSVLCICERVSHRVLRAVHFFGDLRNGLALVLVKAKQCCVFLCRPTRVDDRRGRFCFEFKPALRAYCFAHIQFTSNSSPKPSHPSRVLRANNSILLASGNISSNIS